MSKIEDFLCCSFEALRSAPQSNEFVNRLASMINETVGDSGTGPIAKTIREEILKLVTAGLGNSATIEERNRVETIVRNGRSILLRVRLNVPNSGLFPVWVGNSLVETILSEVENDFQRGMEGSEALSLGWTLMLGANFAAIQDHGLQVRFFKLLKKLVKHPAFDDPFLQDRVFIMESCGYFED